MTMKKKDDDEKEEDEEEEDFHKKVFELSLGSFRKLDFWNST